MLCILSASGQGFGPQQVLSTNMNSAQSVYATDLDGDGDNDILAAAHNNNRVAWYENLGGGNFGPQTVITLDAIGVRQIYATDLDGDGDADVLSTSDWDDKVAWYENLGGGVFSAQIVIATSCSGPVGLYATDLDGDGDADVLVTAYDDDKVAWFENLGGGSFSAENVITTSINGPRSVYATDLDGDGDADVVAAGYIDNKITWYENLGGGNFGPLNLIPSNVDKARCVFASDLDNDGYPDVMTASLFDKKIAWYRNLGGSGFSTENIITTDANFAEYVYATDVNGDGYIDVLSASAYDDKIAWYENLGGGNFGPQNIISTEANYAFCVHAADLDGDGDPDAISASAIDSKIAWYENLTGLSIEVSGIVPACPGSSDGAIEIDASGTWQAPFAYYWDNGTATGSGAALNEPFTIDDLPGGTYDILIVDASGDSASVANIEVTEDRPDCQPCLAVFTVQDECLGSDVVFDASGSEAGTAALLSEYFWDFGDGRTGDQAIELHEYTTAGSYEVLLVITDDAACSDSLSLTVNIHPSPLIQSAPIGFCDSVSYVLPGGQWVGEAGAYIDTLNTSEGCDSVVVTELFLDPSGCAKTCRVLAPSAFSPDGDGVNDAFRIFATCEDSFNAFSLTVYNRWGEAVFTTTDYRDGWNGKVFGEPAEIGIYPYSVRYRLENSGAEERLIGTVTVIR